MKINKNKWKSMKINGNKWKSIENHWKSWTSIINENLWKAIPKWIPKTLWKTLSWSNPIDFFLELWGGVFTEAWKLIKIYEN